MPGFKPRADVKARRAQVLRLRMEHRSYAEIAEMLDISPSTARGDYKRGLDAYAAEVKSAAHLAVEQELARLDAIEAQAWAVLHRKHYTVSNGVLVHLNGEPLEDDGGVAPLLNTLIRVEARRAALQGTDAPAKIDISDARAAEIRKLAADLAIGIDGGTTTG